MAVQGGKPKKKAPAKKAPAKKAPAKKAKSTGAKRKAPAAFMKALTPDAKLAAIVGSKPLPRTEIVKKIWVYIKKNKLQDPKQGQYILAKNDAAFRAFAGVDRVFMMKLGSLIKEHTK